MGKTEDRLERIEGQIERLGLGSDGRAADMSPAERRARILEIVSKDIGLGHVMTQSEYEDWLVKTYPVAASAPLLPDSRFQDPSELDETERRGLIEAYRAREAWHLFQRRRV
jgi:hypothetical protein